MYKLNQFHWDSFLAANKLPCLVLKENILPIYTDVDN